MSYNGSGTFVLNVGGYPYVPSTVIVSANVNALLQDIANGLTLAVTRDGQMSMTGPLHMANQLIDGIKYLQFGTSVNAPPANANGIFLTATNTIGIATNGAVSGTINATGDWTLAPASGTALTITSASGATGLQVNQSGATANAVNIVGPAATQFNAIVLQQGVQSAWTLYQTAGDNTLRFANSGDHVLFAAAGNVTINVPTSGIALTVNGSSANTIAKFTQPNTSGQDAIQLDLNHANGNGLIFNDLNASPQSYRIGLGIGDGSKDFKIYDSTNAVIRVALTSAGNFSILAPTSGIALTVNAVSLASALTVASSGAVSIGGTTTNDNASAGFVGEYLTSNASPTVTTATLTNVTTISLTAGDWDVWGSVFFSNSSSAISNPQAGISTTSATLPASGLWIGSTAITLSTNFGYTVPSQRLSLSSTTTVYLVENCSFGSGTQTVFGYLSARRRR